MTTLRDDILEWLHKQSDWLQVAAERILATGAVSESDVAEIADYLKSDPGQQITKHRSFDNLARSPTGQSNLRLNSIGDVVGIENLAPRRPLVFGSAQLTIVYGQNGSGKSGYTRILKKSCGKPRAGELRSNVFKEVSASRRCKIGFRINGLDRSIDWPADGGAIDELRAVDIFDSDIATSYVSREAEASYTPPEIALFEKMASACDKIRAKIQHDQAGLVTRLPSIPAEFAGTGVAHIYQTLKAELGGAALSQLTEWKKDHQDALDELVRRLKDADPQAQAAKKRSVKEQIDRIIRELAGASNALNSNSIELINNLRLDAEQKRRIAAESAAVTAQSAKLGGIGTDTWNALWRAARAYSLLAYVEREFPVTDEGARCVLCHQELRPEAQQRLRDFESFVQGVVESEAKAAESAYRLALANMPKVPSADQIRTQLQAAGLDCEQWFTHICDFWKGVSEVSERLTHGEIAGGHYAIVSPIALLDELRRLATVLETEACVCDQDATGFDRARALQEKTELEAQQWCAQQTDAIKDEVERLKQVAKYSKWAASANSRPVSIKAGELAERVITDAFVRRFEQELKILGASRIRVELVKAGASKGRVLHRMILKDVVGTHAVPEVVLSEGERRVVSMAAFLADVVSQPNYAPFIFDDPISSLDQQFEERVIRRLISLSENRQVIVFTHRLSFLGLAQELAGDGLAMVHISQEVWGSGEPGSVPIYGKKPEGGLKALRDERIVQARRALESGGVAEYYPFAKAICSDFRILLERLVENVLLADIVQRHRRAINTLGKIEKLAKISGSDCALIDRLMTKYSCFEHSQSAEAPVDLPTPEDISADLGTAIAWAEEFSKRT